MHPYPKSILHSPGKYILSQSIRKASVNISVTSSWCLYLLHAFECSIHQLLSLRDSPFPRRRGVRCVPDDDVSFYNGGRSFPADRRRDAEVSPLSSRTNNRLRNISNGRFDVPEDASFIMTTPVSLPRMLELSSTCYLNCLRMCDT